MPDSTPMTPQNLIETTATNDAPAPADSTASNAAATDAAAASSSPAAVTSASVDLNWVWREVRKRVFIKLPFSLGVADAMEAVVPITLTDDAFVCGLSARGYALSGHLQAAQVRNTIENILRQAARRPIRFELIEGTSASDWQALQERQHRAHTAVVAMAEKKIEEHHYDDVLNQVVSEMRRRITSTPDRMLPPIRAHLMLEIVPQLADIEEMLFAQQESHERRRSMARAIDRIASFLDVPPFMLALEIERLRMFEMKVRPAQSVSATRVAGTAPDETHDTTISGIAPNGDQSDVLEPERPTPTSSPGGAPIPS